MKIYYYSKAYLAGALLYFHQVTEEFIFVIYYMRASTVSLYLISFRYHFQK